MISRELREAVRRAYNFRCGYCGIHENEVGSEDDLTLHLQQAEDGWLAALTERGALHLQRLRLNRPQLIAARLSRQQRHTDAQELAALRAEIERINQHRAELEAQLQEISEQLTRSND